MTSKKNMNLDQIPQALLKTLTDKEKYLFTAVSQLISITQATNRTMDEIKKDMKLNKSAISNLSKRVDKVEHNIDSHDMRIKSFESMKGDLKSCIDFNSKYRSLKLVTNTIGVFIVGLISFLVALFTLRGLIKSALLEHAKPEMIQKVSERGRNDSKPVPEAKKNTISMYALRTDGVIEEKEL